MVAFIFLLYKTNYNDRDSTSRWVSSTLGSGIYILLYYNITSSSRRRCRLFSGKTVSVSVVCIRKQTHLLISINFIAIHTYVRMLRIYYETLQTFAEISTVLQLLSCADVPKINNILEVREILIVGLSTTIFFIPNYIGRFMYICFEFIMIWHAF